MRRRRRRDATRFSEANRGLPVARHGACRDRGVRSLARSFWLWAAACLCPAIVCAAEPLPSELAATLTASGLPLRSFGVFVERVDTDNAPALATLNAERPFLLASTTKLVTSLAALDLLGPAHRWRSLAFATGPLSKGRLLGDLVIVGSPAGLTPAQLGGWFRQMRAEGLSEVGGRIVLDRVSLLHEDQPAQAATTAAERSPGATPDPRTYNRGAVRVTVQPGSGARATVTLQPRPPGVLIVNEVVMGGGCSAWAQWHDVGGGPELWVRGRWESRCGARDIALVRPPRPALPSSVRPVRLAAPAGIAASTSGLVAALWAEAGGRLRGGVVEAPRRAVGADPGLPEGWSSQLSTPLPAVIREMNKTSNNLAARQLLLQLAPPLQTPAQARRAAQDRVQAWLRTQGLADGDIRIDQGSGQSRLERGKPRAMVELLRRAWRGNASTAFVGSLPIAGVDGTLAHRLRGGAAAGQAWLKTGTLSDARALAGYVRARSGKVYAVAALVNDPEAARATPALDALIEWVARNG